MKQQEEQLQIYEFYKSILYPLTQTETKLTMCFVSFPKIILSHCILKFQVFVYLLSGVILSSRYNHFARSS